LALSLFLYVKPTPENRLSIREMAPSDQVNGR